MEIQSNLALSRPMHTNATSRWGTAFLVSPLLPGFLVLCYKFARHPDFTHLGSAILMWLFLSVLSGYPSYLLIGLPMFLLCAKAKLVRLDCFFLLGGLAGYIFILFFQLIPPLGFTNPTFRSEEESRMAFALAGAISGAVTWIIVRPYRAKTAIKS